MAGDDRRRRRERSGPRSPGPRRCRSRKKPWWLHSSVIRCCRWMIACTRYSPQSRIRRARRYNGASSGTASTGYPGLMATSPPGRSSTCTPIGYFLVDLAEVRTEEGKPLPAGPDQAAIVDGYDAQRPLLLPRSAPSLLQLRTSTGIRYICCPERRLTGSPDSDPGRSPASCSPTLGLSSTEPRRLDRAGPSSPRHAGPNGRRQRRHRP